MNNFHIYEEVGRGKYSVVYKASLININDISQIFIFIILIILTINYK